MLSLHHISKYYGTHCLLNNISLHIEPQTTHIIYGVSGSGKTTLLNILSGHETFEEGSRVVESGLRIHYATQTAHFIDDFTMAENLLFAARDKHQHTILLLSKKLGVDTKLNSYPYQLSGGERQRFNIIRALLDNPHVVILDEPTSALDASTKHWVLQELQHITHAALIIVTHDLAIADELPSTSYVLDKGTLSQRLT